MGPAEQMGRWREGAREVRATRHKPATSTPQSQGCQSRGLRFLGPARVLQGGVVQEEQGGPYQQALSGW